MTEVHPLQTCSTCKHWNTERKQISKDFYLIAVCEQPEDERDHKLQRGSDYCGHWQTK